MNGSFLLLLVASCSLVLFRPAESACTSVYTTGDDEVCHVDLETLNETCVTFNGSYNIANTNGFGMHPLTGDLYIMASIGSNQGDRMLFRLNNFNRTNNNMSNYDGTLTAIGYYNNSNDKISAMAFGWGESDADYYDISLYGITGFQADHSLYTIDYTMSGAGELTFVSDIDVSDEGNGMTFDYTSGTDGNLYRISGNKTLNLLDIEEINPSTGNITFHDFINATEFGIGQIRSVGYFDNDYTFLIDQYEDLYLANVFDGSDVTQVDSLSTSRKHKGIICTNALIGYYDTTTTTTATTTMAMNNNTDDSGNGSDGDGSVERFGITQCCFVVVTIFWLLNNYL